MPHTVPLAQARVITDEVETAIAGIFAKHGYAKPNIKLTYGDLYRLKVESTPLAEGDNGVNLNSPEAQAYISEANFRQGMGEDFVVRSYGGYLDPDALGREFTIAGDTFVLLGMNPKARKYPFVIRRESDGSTRKAPEEMVGKFLRPQEDATSKAA